MSLALEKVTPSLGLSQAACASPFSAGPGLTVLVLGPLPEAPIIKSEQPGCRAHRHRFSNLSARKGLRLQRLSPGPPRPGCVSTPPGEQDKLSPSFLNLSVAKAEAQEAVFLLLFYPKVILTSQSV